MKLALVVALLLSPVACGGHQGAAADPSAADFQCRERSISMMTTFSGGNEHGILMDCKAGPRIKRWRTEKSGKHDEDVRAIDAAMFDHVWSQIDATGWPNLHDCANGSRGKTDPDYTFDIKDDQNSASFDCQTREMPYPYNGISDPLSLTANQGRPQLGDDEPPDAKAVIDKEKQ